MRTAKRNVKFILAPTLLLLFLGLGGGAAHGQDELFEDDGGEALNSAPIDIDGKPKDPIQESYRKLENQRRKTHLLREERRNKRELKKAQREESREDKRAFSEEDRKDRRMELDERRKDKELERETHRIKRLLENEPDKSRAAEAKKSAPEKKVPSESRFVVNLGTSRFSGENISLMSKPSMIINIENKIGHVMSVGFSAGYTAMTMKLDENNFHHYVRDADYYYNYYMGYSDFSSLGNAEAKYRRLHLDLIGKFYLVENADYSLRPYFGVGVGYNYTTLSYDKDKFNLYTRRRDDSISASASQASALVMLGAEMRFTRIFGLDANASFRRNLGSAFSDKDVDFSGDGYINNYEEVLKNLGEKIEESNEFSLRIGMYVTF